MTGLSARVNAGVMPDRVMFDFLAPLAVKEGATVIRPLPGAEGSHYHRMRDIIDQLRHIPSQIDGPPGENLYRFAERGVEGHWMLVWVPRKDQA